MLTMKQSRWQYLCNVFLKSDCCQCLIWICLLLIIYALFYALYLSNFQIIAHYYYFQNETTSEISIRAVNWTVIELFAIPLLIGIIVGAIFLIWSTVIVTVDDLYEGSKAYDKNVLLLQQKQDV